MLFCIVLYCFVLFFTFLCYLHKINSTGTDSDSIYIRLETLNKACSDITVKRSYIHQNTHYPQSHRTNTVDTYTQINNRPQSVDKNLSNVYSRNPRPSTHKE